MRKVDPAILKPGLKLPMGLYTRHGVKLLNAGVTLSEALISVITQSKWGALYLASSAHDLVEGRVLVPGRQADEGEVAEADLVTAGGMLVAQAGDVIEPHHADAYALGAFQGPTTREDRRQRAQRMKIADSHVAEIEEQWKRLPRRINADPAAADRPVLGPAPKMPEPHEVAAWRAQRRTMFRSVFARILSGVRTELSELLVLVDELVRLWVARPDEFAQIPLLDRGASETLPDHCYATAGVSIAIAGRLGWSIDHMRLAGLAGLLADVGMGMAPEELRSSGRPLSEVELNRVRRHPAYSVVLLESVEGLPEEVRMAAYQHHERENGSGYPAAAKSGAICDLARVVSVADTYVAATAARKYKPARRPYDAIEEAIMLGSSRVFDRRFVRALVEAIGLFPVGSYVQLSSGAEAQVVGAHANRIDRPLVRFLTPGVQRAPASLVLDLDMLDPWELHVIRAIDPPRSVGLGPLTRAAS